ncbi:DUF5700 domain-containing putative Zn-dependent protease [Sediminibacterium ginsengisoli]|uniref:Uncharacterized protein n=1 Tax=Sediminibacterium ginsengisoli TaxID=413434 RepID=A0A1T4M7N3_9BACT|nr:DUF5700 domain-containing putative Zn-dependent protease [Sediminibacterium ginsengisoli]SJZ62798.1 hypothetical protein SAMN04488132_103220 [Sediminibacterium ginsengisoli]
MKNHSLRRSLLLFLSGMLFPVVTVLAAPGLQVIVDAESAKANIALLGKKQVTDQELNDAAALYGNQQLIAKVKSYSGAGKDVFISTLKAMIIDGNIKGDDPYNWRSVKAALPEMKQLIGQIDANSASFIEEVKNSILSYTPAGLDITIKACFLAGGGALGFTIGNDKTFNVALQKLDNDFNAMKLLVAHELYHIVQAEGQSMRKKTITGKDPYFLQATAALLENLWSEGSANLAGDFAGFEGKSAFAKEQTAEWAKNADRRRENFALFEAVLYKSYYDTSAKRYEQHYNICFSTAYDETAYFTGYEMAKAIVKYKGRKALADLVLADPANFIAAYIDIYKSEKDSRLIRFDASTEAIVAEMLQRSREWVKP